jgi:hypothetical protein
MSVSLRRLLLFAAAFFVMAPSAAMAQGAIAGFVRDTTGSMLPGVTVEASSPALIEKVRTVVTDGQGRYLVVDLRPGSYVVTFSLPGFSTIKREGIELSGTFTATVNVDMAVGTLEETVTVSGASPLVDVQNVVQERVMTAETVSALPTARTFQTLAAVIPGLTTTAGVGASNQDVGGSMGDQSQTLAIHGGKPGDQQNMIDGFYMNGVSSTTQLAIYLDMGSMQETRYELGAIGADTTTGGVHVNFILKDGGNLFRGSVFGAYANNRMQAKNITDDLKARGIGSQTGIDKVWDFNPGMGGPVKKDKVWFYASARVWGTNNRVPGIWYDKDPLDNVYTPDFDRPGIEDTRIFSGSLRLTWQVNAKNKVSAYHVNQQGRCLCHRDISSTRAPEASRKARSPLMHVEIYEWTAPLTNKLLLEAGGIAYTQLYSVEPQPDVWQPGVLALTELTTGLNWRMSNIGHDGFGMRKFSPKASLSYVTGSHAFKTGLSLQRGWIRNFLNINGDMTLALRNGVPASVTLYTTPYNVLNNLNEALALYAMDQWTHKRVTLNIGASYDIHKSGVPEQHLSAVQFVGPRDFAAIDNVPLWKDFSPRLGVALDLFGNGRTAIKASFSRYVAGQGTGFANANNPVLTSVNSATRTWNDVNGDFKPQCNFTNPAANQECGVLTPSTFGQLRVTTRYDDAVRTGLRGYNWESSVGINQELWRGVSAEVSYHGRRYGNFSVTDNLAVTPANFDPYCITAPTDSRLPGGGGFQQCGLYDVNPSKVGQVDNLVTDASKFGRQTENYHGADFLMNARLGSGGRVGGGVNTGRTTTDNCEVVGKVDNPASGTNANPSGIASPSTLYCRITPPFQMNARAYAVYPLPWELQASATFQTIPGPMVIANYVMPNSQIAPSLGRNLSAGATATATIPLVEPGSMYGDRLYQTDLRLTKMFRMGTRRFQANLDLYNLLNASPVLLQNNTYGPAWQRPMAILPGRLIKFGGQYDF